MQFIVFIRGSAHVRVCSLGFQQAKNQDELLLNKYIKYIIIFLLINNVFLPQ